MKLSLSTRAVEAPKPRKDLALMDLSNLARAAKDAGYRALCMRASQVGVHTPAEELKVARKVLDGSDLQVSMVPANNEVPLINERAGMALREARRACDEAAERGIRS